MSKVVTIAAALGLSLSSMAFSYDFSKADAKFAKREAGLEASVEARNEYAKALDANLSAEEKIYAVTQMGRSGLYAGMRTDGDVEARKSALEQCIEDAELISETNRQEYHYFTVACIAFRGKLASTLGRASWALKMRRVQGPALDSTKVGGQYVGGFEGGGILRVMSALRGNRAAKFLGLYDPVEAVQFSELALSTPSKSSRPYPGPLSGVDYYENHYYLAQSKIALATEQNKHDLAVEGQSILKAAMEAIDVLADNDELPKGREPETKHYRSLMEELKGKVDGCLSSSNWSSCLVKKLDE